MTNWLKNWRAILSGKCIDEQAHNFQAVSLEQKTETDPLSSLKQITTATQKMKLFCTKCGAVKDLA